MKPSKRVLSVGLAMAGLISSSQFGYGGVGSINVVGYVNVPLSPGFNLIANPLNTTNNNANYLMPGVPDGAALFRFDPVSQRYLDAATYFSGVGWYPISGNTNDPALILNPGEGFFIHTPQAVTITFVGEVLQGYLTNPIPANFSLKASMVPQAGKLQTDLKFPPVQDDYIWRWDASGQTFTFLSPYFYSSPVWAPSEPSINVAEGFIVHRDPALATPDNWWIRNFIVNSLASALVSAQAGVSADQPVSPPAIRGIIVKGGAVNLNILNPGGGSYNVQFSTDGIAWGTVATGQTGTSWSGAFPGGARGYYQLVSQ